MGSCPPGRQNDEYYRQQNPCRESASLGCFLNQIEFEVWNPIWIPNVRKE